MVGMQQAGPQDSQVQAQHRIIPGPANDEPDHLNWAFLYLVHDQGRHVDRGLPCTYTQLACMKDFRIPICIRSFLVLEDQEEAPKNLQRRSNTIAVIQNRRKDLL
jgi:hypothetical protein